MAVELNVNSQLLKVIDDLKKIAVAQDQVMKGFQGTAKTASEGIEENSRRSKDAVSSLGDLARRTAIGIKEDFKALLSINGITQSLKFSKFIGESINETVALADTIRKLGQVFDIPGERFKKFHSNLIRGFGQIGLSSEAADKALQGLSKTPLRRDEGLIQDYALNAGKLASITGQRGSEGQIAKGLVDAVIARGQSPNDKAAMKSVAEDVVRIRRATGMGATEALGTMNELFSGAHPDFQNRLRAGGGVSLSSAALRGGNEATTFLEQYLKMNTWERSGLESRGFKDIISSGGKIDPSIVRGIVQEARNIGGGDTAAGLSTMGLSGEQANGFMRLAKALEENEGVINGAADAAVDMNKELRETMGLFESATAVLSRFKSTFRELIVDIEGGITSLLKYLASSDEGSVLGVGAGVVGAGFMAKAGIGGVGSALGLAKGAGGAAATAASAGGVGLAGPLAVGAAVGYAGYRNAQNAEAQALSPVRAAQDKSRADSDLADKIGKAVAQQIQVPTSMVGTDKKVITIELNKRELREMNNGSRGESYGP